LLGGGDATSVVTGISGSSLTSTELVERTLMSIVYVTLSMLSVAAIALLLSTFTDSALGAACPNSTSGELTTTCSGSPLPNECLPSRTVVGADRKNYRVDTYITSSTPTSGRALKLVTVVVRDGSKLSARPLARVASTFDQSTG
jgi:hypothetical protein